MDGSNLIELAGNPLAQIGAAAMALAGAWRYFKNQSSGDAVTRANDAANLSGIETLKQLLEGERAARIKAEERADSFAKERNDAMQQVWEMRGQLKIMNDTITDQVRELEKLREQVRQLQEQINAKP